MSWTVCTAIVGMETSVICEGVGIDCVVKPCNFWITEFVLFLDVHSNNLI